MAFLMWSCWLSRTVLSDTIIAACAMCFLRLWFFTRHDAWQASGHLQSMIGSLSSPRFVAAFLLQGTPAAAATRWTMLSWLWAWARPRMDKTTGWSRTAGASSGASRASSSEVPIR